MKRFRNHSRVLKVQKSEIVEAIALRLSVPSVKLFMLNGSLALCNLIVSVLLARALEPDERGTLATLTLWAMIAASVSMLGLHLSLARDAASEPSVSRAIYRTGLGLLMGLSVVGSAFYALMITQFVSPYTGMPLVLCGMAIIPFSMWNALQVQVELGTNRLNAYVVAFGSFTITHLLLVAILFMAGIRDAPPYLVSFLLAAVLAAIVTHRVIHWTLGPEGGESLPERPRAILIRAARRDGLSVMLVALATMADKILVSLFFDTATLGIYVVSLALAQIQIVVSQSMAPLFFTRLARDRATILAAPGWLAQRLRQTLLINTLVGFSVIAMAPLLLQPLYGKIYLGALEILILLVVASSLRGMMRPFEEVLKGSNEALRQSVSIALMTGAFAVVAVPGALIGEIQIVVAGLIVSGIAGLTFIVIATSHLLGCSLGELVVPRFADVRDLKSMAFRLLRGQAKKV